MVDNHAENIERIDKIIVFTKEIIKNYIEPNIEEPSNA